MFREDMQVQEKESIFMYFFGNAFIYTYVLL
jgi:hypothetical protein